MSDPKEERVNAHIFVEGTVQGVFFRASTKQAAKERGISGWVRNLPDGRVEAEFEGTPDLVESMIEWCNSGSELASVTSVTVAYSEPKGIEGFSIRYS